VTDYETTQRRRNVIVGIFVLLAVCALGIMIYKFGDLPGTVSRFGSYPVKAQFPTATGVEKDTPVRFCGYQIGRVTSVEPPRAMKDLNTGEFYHQTLVVLSIDQRYDDIPADVEPKLMTRGLGSSYIELKLRHFDVNEPKGPFLTKNSLLQGSTGMTSEFFPEESQKKLEELVNGIKAFIDNANDILGDPRNKQNVKAILANLTEATNEATTTMKELQKFSAAGTKTLKNADVKIDTLIAAMTDTTEQLGRATAELRLILEKVNAGQGTAARLLNDGKFYENLLENTQQIQVLLEKWTAFIDDVNKKGRFPIKLK